MGFAKSVVTFLPDILRGVVFVLGWLRKARSWTERNSGALADAFWWVEFVGEVNGWNGPKKARQYVLDLERRLGKALTAKQLRAAEDWAAKAAKQLKQ